MNDVAPALALFTTREYNEAREVLPGVKLTFTDAGHILGSACVHLDIEVDGAGARWLTFSGDVGRYVDRLLPDPATFRQSRHHSMRKHVRRPITRRYTKCAMNCWNIVRRVCGA